MYTLALVSLNLLYTDPGLAQEEPEDVTWTARARVDALPDSAVALLLTTLARQQPFSQWDAVAVEHGMTLYDLIETRYRYFDSEYPRSAAALARVIADANELGDINIIPAGQILRIPNLPLRPYSMGARETYAQVYSATAEEPVAFGRIVETGEIITEEAAGRLPQGAVWQFALDASDVSAILTNLAPRARSIFRANTLMVPQPTATVDVHFLTREPSSRSVSAVKSVLHQESPYILPHVPEPDIAGQYVLFDVFGSAEDAECLHGDRVYGVVEEVLKQHGAGSLLGNVVRVDIDYLRHLDTANGIIRQYLETLPMDAASVSRYMQDLRSAAVGSGTPLRVPAMYLQALYGTVVREDKVSVVSASFWTSGRLFRILPYDYWENRYPVLLAAVLNDPGFIETISVEEPLRTFRDLRHNHGTVLVGGEEAPGVYFGMSSRKGDAVTTLARGQGWGEPGECLTPDLRGTSFASPAIGGVLFLASAIWRARGDAVSVVEAKTRLLLATEVVPAYVGRFASAGVPELRKLVLPEGTYGVTPAGEIVEVQVTEGLIAYESPEGVTWLSFGKGSNLFRGIQLVEGSVFILTEATSRWQRVALTSVRFVIDRAGDEKQYRDWEELQAEFQEVFRI